MIQPLMLAISFISPGLAWLGLGAISVPIIIHLLSKRPRKPQPWAAMRFLLAAFKKHKTRTRIEQLLLLACRCLILLLLGLALAGPMLDKMFGLGIIGASSRTVILVVDNSVTSATKTDTGEPRFDAIRKAAVKMVETLEPTDRLAIITAAEPVTAVIAKPSLNPDSFKGKIQNITPSASKANISKALTLALDSIKQVESENRPTYVALLSDFSNGSTPVGPGAASLDGELQQLGKKAVLMMLEPHRSTENVQITELTADQNVVIAKGSRDDTTGTPVVGWRLVLKRFSHDKTAGEQTGVEVKLRDDVVFERVVKWQNGETERRLDFNTPLSETGLYPVTARITTPDALDIDNSRTMLVRAKQKLNILILGAGRSATDQSPETFVDVALAPVADKLGYPLEVKQEDADRFNQKMLEEVDVIFVLRPDRIADNWKLLHRWASGGGLVWVTPPPTDTGIAWPPRMTGAFGLEQKWTFADAPLKHPKLLKFKSDDQTAEEFRRETDLPDLLKPLRVIQHLPVNYDSADTRTILTGEDGSNLMIATDVAPHGRLYYLAVAIDKNWSNLPISPFNPALIQHVVRTAIDRLQPPQIFEPGRQPSLSARWANIKKLDGPNNESVLLEINRTTQNGSPNASDPNNDPPSSNGTTPGQIVVRPSQPLLTPGIYSGGTSALVVNVNPDAGNTLRAPDEPLKKWLGTAGEWQSITRTEPEAVIMKMSELSDYGWELLWAVLILAIIEMFLARYVSHASTTHRTQGIENMAPNTAAKSN